MYYYYINMYYFYLLPQLKKDLLPINEKKNCVEKKKQQILFLCVKKHLL